MFKKIKNYFHYYLLGVLFLATVFVWYAVYVESPSGKLKVYFLDVGQGDAELIETPNGNKILIDGGPPNKKILGELSRFLPFYNRSVDMVILTHPHADHVGGLDQVLERYEVGFAMDPGVLYNTPEFGEYRNLIETKRIPRVYGVRGMKVRLDYSTYLDVFLPVVNNFGLSPHDGMLVLKLNYGKNSFLFTGDMEKNLEGYLIGTMGESLKSDILKVGHHGSKTSTTEAFLGYVSPKYAVISVGEENKYGHPSKEVLDRLIQFGVKFFRTDEEGTIRMKSDGETVSIF